MINFPFNNYLEINWKYKANVKTLNPWVYRYTSTHAENLLIWRNGPKFLQITINFDACNWEVHLIDYSFHLIPFQLSTIFHLCWRIPDYFIPLKSWRLLKHPSHTKIEILDVGRTHVFCKSIPKSREIAEWIPTFSFIPPPSTSVADVTSPLFSQGNLALLVALSVRSCVPSFVRSCVCGTFENESRHRVAIQGTMYQIYCTSEICAPNFAPNLIPNLLRISLQMLLWILIRIFLRFFS